MLLKRVGIPVLAILVAVLLALAFDRSWFGVAAAAPVGDVSLSTPLQVPVTIQGIAPGDKGSAGSIRVRYTGNVTAWVGLDAALVGPLSSGGSPLSVTISGEAGRFSAMGENQVVGLFQPDDVIDLTIDYHFPREAGNSYQKTDASLILRLHAVEAEENTAYALGTPVGPISWGRTPGGQFLAGRAVDQSPSSGVMPCVGENCSSAGTAAKPAGAVPPSDGQPGVVAGTGVTIVAGTCCQCAQSLLWIGLIYALLLILAMLGSFYLGWYLRCRRVPRRYAIVKHRRLRSAPDLDRTK